MSQLVSVLFAAAAMSIAAGAVVAAAAPGAAAAADSHCTPGARGAEAAPVRTIAVGLAGYSPVSYLDDRKAEPGSPAFAAEHNGATYFLTSEAQRRVFLADPERYMPAYGGACAFGCSVNSDFVPDPASFEIVDGRVALFLKNDEVDARALWRKDPAAAKAKADAYFATKSSYTSRAYEGARNIGADGLALSGYSPVSYIDHGAAERGNPDFAVQHRGATYFLTSAEQVKAFRANPDAYEPQCGGWCAYGMSVGDKFPVDPMKFKVVDGKLYMFLNNSNVDALRLWDNGSERDQIAKAGAHWRKVSGG